MECSAVWLIRWHMFPVCVATIRHLVPVPCWHEAETDIAGAESPTGFGEVAEVAPPSDDDAWRGHVKRDWIRGGELLIIESKLDASKALVAQ